MAPTVTLTAPTGSSSTVGTPIQVVASAADTDGTIARVEFYNGASPLFTDISSPYTATFTPTAAGSYILSAKAYDDKGDSATSPPVRHHRDCRALRGGQPGDGERGGG